MFDIIDSGLGFLGTQLDAGKRRGWRPSVALCQHDHLPVDRLELLHDRRHLTLAQRVQQDIATLSPGTEVLLRVRNLLRMRYGYVRQLQISEELERKVQARTQELTRATDAFVHKLAQVCEMRDIETGKHILRVGRMARMLAEACGMPETICFMIERAAPLHDVGKIGIPDEILLKPGKLTDDEYLHMKTHATIVQSILNEHDSLLVQMAATIATSHHERWDGTGYPEGLRGESIPIEGRITAICDVFDALMSQRPYKNPWSEQDAVEYLVSQSGHQFDPKLVDLFVQHINDVERIRDECDAMA